MSWGTLHFVGQGQRDKSCNIGGSNQGYLDLIVYQNYNCVTKNFEDV